MTRSFGREGLKLCALVGFLAATGCTNSNVITSGGAPIELDGVPKPAYTSPDYALATFIVSQLQVRPTDPKANEALGPIGANDPGKGIGLMQVPALVNLKVPAGTLLGQAVLNAGEYRATLFRIIRVELNAVLPPPPTPDGAQCSGGVLTSLLTEPSLTLRFSASDLFVVPNEGQLLLELQVDGDKFIQLLKNHCVGSTFTFPSASEFEAAKVFSVCGAGTPACP